jgi:exoribonuclease-2
MLQRGLLPDFSDEALAELGRIQAPASISGEQVRDLRDLLWASIDNDDSRDLDQLTVAESMSGDKVKILVAVADVDSVVNNGSAIDGHPAIILPLCIPLPGYSRCFLKSFQRTSHH